MSSDLIGIIWHKLYRYIQHGHQGNGMLTFCPKIHFRIGFKSICDKLCCIVIFYLIAFSISSLTVYNLSSLQPSCCQTRIGISPFTPSSFSIQHVEMYNGCLLRQFHFHHLQHVAYSRCSTYRFVNNNVLGLCRHRQQQGTDHQYILHKFILHLLLL